MLFYWLLFDYRRHQLHIHIYDCLVIRIENCNGLTTLHFCNLFLLSICIVYGLSSAHLPLFLGRMIRLRYYFLAQSKLHCTLQIQGNGLRQVALIKLETSWLERFCNFIKLMLDANCIHFSLRYFTKLPIYASRIDLISIFTSAGIAF